jgi:hypothetical protein
MSNLSYGSQAEKNVDKSLLDALRIVLDITPTALCLDDCGLWQLRGSRGRITTWGDGKGYLLNLYERHSVRAANFAKKRLQAVGCVITQDAELEAVFRFELPLRQGAESEIRELAGLRRALSEEATAARSEQARERFGWT